MSLTSLPNITLTLREALIVSIRIPQDRVRIEAEGLTEEGRHAPLHVPTMYHYSPEMALIVMQYLAPPHVMLRIGLIAGHVYQDLGAHLATFLARTLFYTSLFALDSAKHKCALTQIVAYF